MLAAVRPQPAPELAAWARGATEFALAAMIGLASSSHVGRALSVVEGSGRKPCEVGMI